MTIVLIGRRFALAAVATLAWAITGAVIYAVSSAFKTLKLVDMTVE